jgi:hypothetical protein
MCTPLTIPGFGRFLRLAGGAILLLAVAGLWLVFGP